MDNATANRSELVTQLFASLSTEPSFTSPYTHTGNAPVERTNRSFETVLRIHVSENPMDWPKCLLSTVFALNSAVHASTGFSPYEPVYGVYPRTSLDNKLVTSQIPADHLERLHHARVQTQFNILRAQ